MAKGKIRDMTLCAMFAAVTAVCAQITVPAAVPFTMQTFAVFCTLGTLGGRRGTVSVLLYVLLGAAGVPVFAGFKGGLGIILGSTGGYIVGFVLSALVYWAVTGIFGNGTVAVAVAAAAGMLVCYAVGTAWFMAFYAASDSPVGLAAALEMCVLPFIIPDCIKIALSAVVSRRILAYAERKHTA